MHRISSRIYIVIHIRKAVNSAIVCIVVLALCCGDTHRPEPVGMEGGGSGGRAAAVVPARMTTLSRHYFGGSASERHHDLRVDIVEVRARIRASQLLPPHCTLA